MAQPNRGRRPRGRNNNQNRQKFVNKNQAFDSSGPAGRVRGNAQQVAEKYQALARDAQAANETTLAEAHFQHAEHYLRLHNEMMEQIETQRTDKAKRDEERNAERGNRNEPKESAAIEVVSEDSDPAETPQPGLELAEAEAVPATPKSEVEEAAA